MAEIRLIDKNFAVEQNFEMDDPFFYNIKENTWTLFGLICYDTFIRLPKDFAISVNTGVAQLYKNTAGGRLRFITDSPYIALFAKLPDQVIFPHMPLTGVSGFDLYDDDKFVKMYVPETDFNGTLKGIHCFREIKERKITITFPLYNGVDELYIALKKGSTFKAYPYEQKEKAVFYGSSITQGGCASRPGLAYPNILCNKLQCDYLNLGFSGSALGEECMAEYIAKLNPDIFVMDYDHNAPSADFLNSTHLNFFNTFRKLKPKTPVILVTAPNINFSKDEFSKRRSVIMDTYNTALKNGDENVYFVDGERLWESDFDVCSVDGLHPNDIGMYRMADTLYDVLIKLRADNA